MPQAILDCQCSVSFCVRTIHWLQKKVAEVELLEIFRRRIFLRVDKLQLVPGGLYQRGTGFGTHADPVQRPGGRPGAVGFDGDLKTALVEGGNQRFIDLE